MKKTKILFPLFLSIILIFSFFAIPFINAIPNYYNHLQNPSFVNYSNYIEFGGFENANFDEGVTYGNWTISSGSPDFSLVKPYTGQYSMQLESGDYIWYNFTDTYNSLGADIEQFGFWYWTESNNCIDIFIHYDDVTTTHIDETVTTGCWTFYDVTSFINVDKIVEEIEFRAEGALWYMYDVIFMVDDGGGQDSLGANTVPWSRVMNPNIWDLVGLKDDFGRLDNSSAYFYNLGESGYIMQDINFLDASFVHYADLYYYVEDSTDMALQYVISYDDGSISYSIKSLTVNSTWTYLNFGVSFISSTKNIVGVSIRIYSGSGSEIVHIDDVGIWASVAIDYTRFDYTITPYPTQKGSQGFMVSTGVQYIMTCYLYDDSSGLTYNGTFSIFDSTGETTGDMTDGTFNYVIIKRYYLIDTIENFVIRIVTDNNVYTILLVAIFDYIPIDDDIPITPTKTSDFMFLFIFIVIPSMFLAVILKPVGIPIIGFLSGLTIMTAIGRTVGIIDLWFLFVMVLVVVLLILAMLKKGIYV